MSCVKLRLRLRTGMFWWFAESVCGVCGIGVGGGGGGCCLG